MADESENIEARLAAYIDDDLLPQDRIDIEQYLAANPSHAVLIESMRAQHEQLADLPREKAPPEIMDNLQQHLERHALLSDVDDHTVARASRWPQWTAVAAMLMLAGGLGLLVYQVLPGGGRPEHLVIEQNLMQSLSKLPATEQSADQNADSPIDATRSDSMALPSQQGTMKSQQTTLQQQVGGASKNDVATGLAASEATTARPRDFVEEMADKMAAQQQARRALAVPTGRHATLSIASHDPEMSSALVAEYLVQNGLQFDSPHTTTPTAMTQAPATQAPAPNQPAPNQPATNQPATNPSEAIPNAMAFNATLSNATTLILHNITAEHARGLLIAISDLQAGKQQVTLQPLPASATVLATQPAASVPQALVMLEKANTPSTAPAEAAAAAPAAPALPMASVEMKDKADKKSAAPAVMDGQPATQMSSEKSLPGESSAGQSSVGQSAAGLPSMSQPSTMPVSSGLSAPGQTAANASAIEEAGDLWIVITPSTAAAVPATLPAIALPPATAPAALPTTLPIEQP